MPYVKGISKLVLLGRLGADAEFSKGRAGQEVARLTVCINTSWKDKHSGEWKEKAEWFHVNAWRHFAALSRRYGKKGTVVYVEGEPHTRKWVGKDGVPQQRLEVRAKELRFLNDPATVSRREHGTVTGREGGDGGDPAL
jgi:single-strand DNA-binding protein